ncbi:MAG: AAA family ATPase [Nitrososphaerota archaeon]|jgi:SpoVK/Ycf46/Vps4 family AAA+-type ATPase|uniref:AAA family ATPase n=1 Tax=Candidatus Bathycorpusculum sp. TaxID=2994959 RepID=UPI00281CE3CA|nr:AAA family ATPase [Candidatus Termiticorpusculum sp.]MCL2257393.1 AAA family ATPase [Candidatus Termiticorpusculum sp.]MCL2292508.1 AAA family ATPase [Candidatus Termiticorpusculum sp.]MDR0460719.1 AAA family ATPase [Nitrososphaerota archaeon]
MSASHELEKAATAYALDAVRMDKQGQKGRAITLYQRAIESLLQLVQLYPEYGLNKVYVQRAIAYQERIKALQGVVSSSEMRAEADSDAAGGGAATLENDGSAKPNNDEIIVTERPMVNWEQVVGLDVAKKAVKEAIVYPVQRPDLFPLGWPRGILLYGPPGCGKTLLAAAVATEIDANFYSIDAASIMSKWLGEAEQNVAKLFAATRKCANEGRAAIVFVDELDSLMGTHSNEVGGEIRVKNQFLKEMDGITDKGKNLHIYIIGATNKPWDLDWAFIRRFQKRILVPLPDSSTRCNMLQHYSSNLAIEAGVDLPELARLTEGFSGSDIRDVCQSAQLSLIGEFFESGKAHDKTAKPRPLTMADFRQILEDRKPSVSFSMLTKYTEWSEAFKAL